MYCLHLCIQNFMYYLALKTLILKCIEKYFIFLHIQLCIERHL